jgi:translocation and assembly module TamB
LAGGGGNSLVDSLRQATGLDDIDLVTDSDGNAAVKAGAYVQDNVYLSVEAGAQGRGKVSIDLDLTDSLKARGSTSNDGENSIGIFYENDF